MYFTEIESCSTTTMQKLWDVINNASDNDWWRKEIKHEWRLSITPDIFDTCPKTKAILNKFVEPHRLYIQRLEPHTCYNWHIDYNRNTSLTLCMNVFENSFSIFGAPKVGFHIPDIVPLHYKPNMMYLIDGSQLHTGLNFSDETRYLVSMSVTRPTNMKMVLFYLNHLHVDTTE
jgi:hypothetical protein